MDTNQAEFWTVSSQTFTGVTGPKTPIPSGQWAWAYCPNGWPGTPNPNWICLKNGTFNPSLLYEMVYTAKNPLVLGVGAAAFRDLGSFLRYEAAAPGGGSNPIFGTVSKTYTVGSSQSGAFLHGFIFWGFNKDENGRKVFDGAWPQIDGRMMVMNIRLGSAEQPHVPVHGRRRSAGLVGGLSEPGPWPSGKRHAPPLRANQNVSGDPGNLRFGGALFREVLMRACAASLASRTFRLPSNVHRYYTAGGTHGGGTANFTWVSPRRSPRRAGQSLPTSPIPATHTNNALTCAFAQLIMSGTPMPPSVYPTLARGELVPNTAAAEGYPDFHVTVPRLTYQGIRPGHRSSMTSDPERTTTRRVAYLLSSRPSSTSVLPVYGVRVNADGNEVATGMPTVLGEAPLGTYVGWNLGHHRLVWTQCEQRPGKRRPSLCRSRQQRRLLALLGHPGEPHWQPVIRVCHSRSGTVPMPATSAS